VPPNARTRSADPQTPSPQPPAPSPNLQLRVERDMLVSIAGALALAVAASAGCTNSSDFDYLMLVQQWPVVDCTTAPACVPTDAYFTVHGVCPRANAALFSLAVALCGCVRTHCTPAVCIV
jgi:hypothetical protein